MSPNGAFLSNSFPHSPTSPQKCDCSNFAIMIEVKNKLQHNVVYEAMLNPVMINGLSGIHLFMKLFTMKLIKETIAISICIYNT